MTSNTVIPDDMSFEDAQAAFNSNSTSIQIDCDFGGRIAPFPVYVGEPKADSHPLHHQAHWLQVERGGTIPPDVMASFETLQKIARENEVSFQMLCVYAFGEAQNGQNAEGEAGGDAFAMSPPETPEVIRPEPEDETFEPEQRNDADADAAAVMAAFGAQPQPTPVSHQEKVSQARDEDEQNPPHSTPPIQG